jgi:hypothetical protein
MASPITIVLNSQGQATFPSLPKGVFQSRFAPPNGPVMDVLSINTAESYIITISAPAVVRAVVVQPDGPVRAVASTQTQGSFFVAASLGFGTAMLQLWQAPSYQLGVLVNPALVDLPIGIDAQGEISVNPADIPVGVQVDPSQSQISVSAAGNYGLAFSLTDASLKIKKVTFDPPASAFPYAISEDGRTATISNNTMASRSEALAVHVLFVCTTGSSSKHSNQTVIIDPTIVNNPINQGGGDGAMNCLIEPRYELVGVGAD